MNPIGNRHSIQIANNPVKRRRILIGLEIATVCILCGLSMAFARPQLEGWGQLEILRVNGVLSAMGSQLTATVRVLEFAPMMLAWILGHGAVWAVAAIFALELVGKYLVARWAFSYSVKGAALWLLATLAAVMPLWSGAWHGHNMAQQLSTIFLLTALGASLRLADGLRLIWIIVGALGVLLSLLSYEALVLCAAAIPLVVLLSRQGPLRRLARQTARASLPVIIGVSSYLVFFAIHKMISGGGYQGILMSGPSPLKTPGLVLTYLYSNTYGAFPLASLLALMIAAWLVGEVTLGEQSRRIRLARIASVSVAILMLPLFSLIYAVNFYFLSDIERIGLPLGFAFVLMCATLAIRYPQQGSPQIKDVLAGALVIFMLGWVGRDAYINFQPYQIQRNVLDQAKALVKGHQGSPVLLRDWTGTLGDFYTFYTPSTLEQAMGVEGMPVKIGLCTPPGVKRHHPKMEKFRGATDVPWCDNLPAASEPQLLLDLRSNPENPLLPPRISSLGIVDGSHFDSAISAGTSGKEPGGSWWITSPRATISIFNRRKSTSDAAWSATLTPPPCPGEYVASITADGKSVSFVVDRPIRHSFTTSVPGNGEKQASIQVTGPDCRPELVNSRTFFIGVTGIEVK